MGDRSGRLHEVEVQVERGEERRGCDEWMDRRADVVAKPGQRQLGGARSAADRVLRLQDDNRPARLGERDRGGEAVRPCADDDGV